MKKTAFISWLDSRPALVLGLLFLLTFVVRLAYMYLAPGLMASPDYVKEYSPLARNILAGNGFAIQAGQPYLDRVPLYSVFLAGVYGVFGASDSVARAALALVDGASAIFVFLIAREVFGKRVAILSALAFALYPPLVHLGTYITADNLFIALNLAFILFLVKFFRAPSLRYAIISGLLLGLASLTKPATIMVPVLLLIAFPLYARYALRSFNLRQVARLGALLLVFLLTILPWSIRNYAAFHEVTVLNLSRATLGDWALVSTMETQTLHVPSGERYLIYEQEKRSTLEGETGGQGNDNPQQQGQALTRSVFKKIASDPLGYTAYLGKKFAYFWYASDSGKYEMLLAVLQGSALLLGVLGLVFFVRKDDWRKVFPLLLVLVYFPAFHTLSFTLARYSMPIMPLVMMFSVYEVVELYRMVRGHVQGAASKTPVPVG